MIAKVIFLVILILKIMPFLLLYLLFFIVITLIYKEHQKERSDAFKNNEFYILKRLNVIHITNIWFELIKIIVFFILTIGLIATLRMINLGKFFSTWSLFTIKSNNILNIILVIIILILMYFQIKFLQRLLKDTFYKMHIYLYHTKIYFKIIDSLWLKCNNHFSIVEKSHSFLNNLLEKNKRYPQLDTKFILYVQNKIQAKPKIIALLKKMYKFVTKYYDLIKVELCIYNYTPHIIIYFALIYDLQNYEVRYFYIAIFIFFMINLYRRLKLFISQLDFYEIDKILSNYFYKSKIHNQLILAKTYNERLILTGNNEDALEVFNYYENKIKIYIERDYIIDYVDIEFKKSYEPYNMRILYSAVLVSYIIFCYNVSMLNGILISIPLLLSFIIYEYCYYIYKKKKKYVMTYVILYIIFLALAIIIVTWIYLTRHTLYFMTDYIWTYKINIQQYYNIEEKLMFIKEYLNFKIQHLSIDKQLDLLKIFKNIPFYDLLQTKTISEIKTYVDDLILMYETMENDIYPLLKQKIGMKKPELTTFYLLKFHLYNVINIVFNTKYK